MERIAQLITDLTEYDTILDSVRNRKTPVEVTGLSPIHKANLAAALAGLRPYGTGSGSLFRPCGCDSAHKGICFP